MKRKEIIKYCKVVSIMSAMILSGCAGKTSESVTKEEPSIKAETEVMVVREAEDTNTYMKQDGFPPFYGIWCGASKNESEANNIISQLNRKGLAGRWFVSADWSNLNSEKWYVITSGIYSTKEEANVALPSVQSVFSDAYIKYSGDYKGDAVQNERREYYTESDNGSPFYGIWCGASKNELEANNIISQLNRKGFAGRWFVSTDWSNLNSEKWYVVTSGVYPTKEAANAALPDVQAIYSSAYVKYSGDYRGNEDTDTYMNTSAFDYGSYIGEYSDLEDYKNESTYISLGGIPNLTITSIQEYKIYGSYRYGYREVYEEDFEKGVNIINNCFTTKGAFYDWSGVMSGNFDEPEGIPYSSTYILSERNGKPIIIKEDGTIFYKINK